MMRSFRGYRLGQRFSWRSKPLAIGRVSRLGGEDPGRRWGGRDFGFGNGDICSFFLFINFVLFYL